MESFDLSRTDIGTFIHLLNYNYSLGLSPSQLTYSVKQLHDQWFSQAVELRSVDQQAFQFLDLPKQLAQVIHQTFAKLGSSSVLQLKPLPASGSSLPLPESNSANFVGTLTGLDTDGSYTNPPKIADAAPEEKKSPLPASVGEALHDELALTPEMLAAADESDASTSPSRSRSNSRSHSRSRSGSANPLDESKSPGPSESRSRPHKSNRNGNSLMALKRAVDHICDSSVREENTIRHLQTIIRQAMAQSGKVTQGVLREHLKRLQSLTPSANGSINEENLEEKLAELSIANSKQCGLCGKAGEKSYTLECTHQFCTECIRGFINERIGQQKAVGMKCPFESCQRELSTADIQSLLRPDEFESYLQATLMAFIEQDDNTFICPNEQCKALISIEPMKAAKPPSPMTELDEEGRPLSEDAWRHFTEYRVRCRECQLIFCAQCKHSPYHKGFTCSQFKEYQAARHCRFCSSKLDESNTWKLGPSPALRDVCTEAECLEKAAIACEKMLPCGCPCGGVKGEATCLPCLKHELECDEEYCGVCYVESLGSAPAVKMTGPCTHIFHFACVKTKLEAKWPGARISFEFRNCPVCKQNMNHPALQPILAPILALEASINEKALARLKYEGRDKDSAIINKNGEYYNDPVRFAMKQYIFHICFKCQKPYFAGGYACQEAGGAFDPAELVCPGCQPHSVDDCSVHGKDWLAFKCRYCCNVGSWYCWGTSHFCDACHKSGVWQTLAVYRTGKNKRKLWEYDNCQPLDSQVKAIGKDNSLTEEQKNDKISKLLSDPKSCPLSCRHPPAGLEYGLGCSMCADSHSSAEKLKESEAVVKAKLSVVKNELMKNGPKQFIYQSDFDQNGVLYYLATCGRTAPYNNPAEAGFVKVTSSGLMGDSAPLSAAVGREVVRCVTAPVKNSWFQFEILEFSLCLTHYTLRHYNSWDTEALRNWVFEGSNDGTRWDLLCVHVNDQSLNRKGGSRTWQVDPRGRRYRFFRILQNGRNSNNNYYLALSGLELYGTLCIADAKADQTPLVAQAPNQAPVPMQVGGAMTPAQRPLTIFPGDVHVRTCVYQQDLDHNGMMYWLGTRFGQSKTWQNPGELGLVRVSCSELASQPPSAPATAVVGREVVRCVSAALPNMWFVIDLTPSGKRIRPTHYTLRHYLSWDLEALRNWRFEASVNGSEWFVLSVHVNDTALDKKGATHTWALPNCQSAFSLFRIWQTGFNSNNHHYLALSGFEIYGDVFDVPQFSGPSPNAQFGAPMQNLPPPAYPAQPSLSPMPIPFNPNDPSLIHFRYTHDFDTNGLFYWLGTAGRRQNWQNPGDLGLVSVQCSALAVNPPSAPATAILGREVVRCVSMAKPEMWFLIDLRDKQFFVTHYTLKHYSSWDTEALRNWRLEGSNDGIHWANLRTHVDDKALNKKGATHTWQISSPQNQLFRIFRIYQFGPNSNNNHYLALSGMEFYGSLRLPGANNQAAANQPQMQPPGQMMQPAALPPPPAYPGSRPSSQNPFASPAPAPAVAPAQAPALAPVPMPVSFSGHRYQEFKEGMTFDYRSDFDENGILFWLGTNQYRQPWQNPALIGAVKVASVPLAVNPPSEPASAIVGRSVVRCVTQPNRESWFLVDFQNWFIKPTHYTLRHYDSWDTEALRDWKLQGSNDGKDWKSLSKHKKDETLNAKGASGTWAIPKCKKAYRMFRILQTGKNSNGHWYMALSGLELYGQVFSFKC